MVRRRIKRANGLRAADVLAAREAPPACQPDEPWEPPTLRFSPTAWAKLLYLCDLGDTEVGGFGISPADDLLYVEDVQLVRQVCTVASVAFDDQSVADFFDRQADLGRKPSQFGRIWLHTHPGDSPQPSGTDEDTFWRVFGRTDWAVMFIIARGGRSYARLRFHVGPGGDVDLPVYVDYSHPFIASDHAAWKAEYAACVQDDELLQLAQRDPFLPSGPLATLEPWDEDDWLRDWEDHLAAGHPAPKDVQEAQHAV